MESIGESLKYKSDIYKIAGFALMSPLGGLILNPKLYFELTIVFYIYYATFCLFLAVMGFMSIVYGYNLAVEEEKK